MHHNVARHANAYRPSACEILCDKRQCGDVMLIEDAVPNAAALRVI